MGNKSGLAAREELDGGTALWHVVFEGEGGMDSGGLFRESLRELCAELQPAEASGIAGGLGLLMPTPNQRDGVGAGRDRWMLDPRRKGKEDLKMLRFLGVLIGAALRNGLALELDLAGFEWRRLLGQAVGEADLAAVDETFYHSVVEARTAAAAGPDRWAALGRMWTVAVAAPPGAQAELRHGGSRRAVAHHDAALYIDACVAYRLRGESAAQAAALRAGFRSTVPAVSVLPFVDWREAERLACGNAAVDLAALRERAVYEAPGGPEHPVVSMLWRVLEELGNDDRGRFLAFAWGRRRLPPQVRAATPDTAHCLVGYESMRPIIILTILVRTRGSWRAFRIPVPDGPFPSDRRCMLAQLEDGLTITVDESLSDEYLPRSHTCFFAVDLPCYSTQEAPARL